ncbi:MAG: Ivy family c-type lysozyme inhibitor [Betaproteobacteria bacterium]
MLPDTRCFQCDHSLALRETRMLDEIDAISSVSGGSFTALAYELYGECLFDLFEASFLKRNVQQTLLTKLVNPSNWPAPAFGSFTRSDLAENYYDEILFHGATFGDLVGKPGPLVVASATEFSSGYRFTFTQDTFDLICSDLSAKRLSLAATASSAVPVAFAPVTLTNWGGTCGMQLPMRTEQVSRLGAAETLSLERSAARCCARRRNFGNSCARLRAAETEPRMGIRGYGRAGGRLRRSRQRVGWCAIVTGRLSPPDLDVRHNEGRNMNCLVRGVVLALAAVCTSAWAQGKLDVHTMKEFGGTYQAECGNNASPKATVFADALVFLNGDKRIAGSNVQSAASFYGPAQPSEFRTVLLSETPGAQLRFAIYVDKSGPYLKLDPDTKLLSAIGPALLEQKFRRCDGSATAVKSAVAPAPPQGSSSANSAKTFKGSALHELSAPGLLYDPKAKAIYYKSLGPLSKEPWLAKLDGPSPQNRPVKVAGADYMLLAACKNHDCADFNAVFLYSAAQDVVYGKVYQRGKSTLIGAPTPAVASELEGLWKKEWRSQPK